MRTRESCDVGEPEHSLRTRERRGCKLGSRIKRRKRRNRRGEIPRANPVVIDFLAGQRRRGDCPKQEPLHRVILLTCEYISSAALTTLLFASYARWLVIMLMNSSTTLTFEDSTYPCCSVPSP